MINTTEYLAANYRSDIDVWVCRWLNLNNPDYFKSCYEYIFNEAITNNWHYWLIDVRGRGKTDKAQQDWYFDEFLPEKIKLLTGRNYLAYLVTPSHNLHIQKMKQFDQFENLNNTSSLTTHFFQSEQEATDWLSKCRLEIKSI